MESGIKMSDANWDMEYAKARDVRLKIIELCEKRRLEVPNLEGISRSWQLEPILKELENNYSDNNINFKKR